MFNNVDFHAATQEKQPALLQHTRRHELQAYGCFHYLTILLRCQSPVPARAAHNWGSMDWEQPVLLMFPSGSQQSGGASQDDTVLTSPD